MAETIATLAGLTFVACLLAGVVISLIYLPVAFRLLARLRAVDPESSSPRHMVRRLQSDQYTAHADAIVRELGSRAGSHYARAMLAFYTMLGAFVVMLIFSAVAAK